MRRRRARWPGALLAAVAAAAACGEGTTPPGEGRVTYVFSFEEDLQGWEPDGTDLADPPVVWSVERSRERASRGVVSVRLFLDNRNDAGKIWIERPFTVEPGRSYDVEVRYDLATADFGALNLFRLITAVTPRSPEVAGDLAYPGDTGNGSETDVGFRWVPRRVETRATAGPDGLLHVAIGVWGTWETARTYFLDDVRITFTPR